MTELSTVLDSIDSFKIWIPPRGQIIAEPNRFDTSELRTFFGDCPRDVVIDGKVIERVKYEPKIKIPEFDEPVRYAEYKVRNS